MSLDLQNVYDNISKSQANLVKMGKALLADRAKAEGKKKVDAFMPKLKAQLEARKKLEKRIEESKKLAADIAAYNNSLAVLATESKNISKICYDNTHPDTPKRDFWIISNLLDVVGQEQNKIKIP